MERVRRGDLEEASKANKGNSYTNTEGGRPKLSFGFPPFLIFNYIIFRFFDDVFYVKHLLINGLCFNII